MGWIHVPQGWGTSRVSDPWRALLGGGRVHEHQGKGVWQSPGHLARVLGPLMLGHLAHLCVRGQVCELWGLGVQWDPCRLTQVLGPPASQVPDL